MYRYFVQYIFQTFDDPDDEEFSFLCDCQEGVQVLLFRTVFVQIRISFSHSFATKPLLQIQISFSHYFATKPFVQIRIFFLHYFAPFISKSANRKILSPYRTTFLIHFLFCTNLFNKKI